MKIKNLLLVGMLSGLIPLTTSIIAKPVYMTPAEGIRIDTELLRIRESEAASEKARQAAEAAAENDSDRIETINDWLPLDVEGWE